jgi:hypothetical protein
VFASVRSVDDAAVMVMLAVPSKETPLIVRAVWSAVAVPALPEMEPVMVWVKVFAPENLFASPRSVVEATVIEPPSETLEPLIVMDEFARSVFWTVAHVATPDPLSERTNWLVQAEPVYATTPPVELPRWSALVTEVTARLVVVAEVVVEFCVMRLPAESIEVEAVAPKRAAVAVMVDEAKRFVVEALLLVMVEMVAEVPVSPPLNAMLVVVALFGKRYANEK